MLNQTAISKFPSKVFGGKGHGMGASCPLISLSLKRAAKLLMSDQITSLLIFQDDRFYKSLLEKKETLIGDLSFGKKCEIPRSYIGRGLILSETKSSSALKERPKILEGSYPLPRPFVSKSFNQNFEISIFINKVGKSNWGILDPPKPPGDGLHLMNFVYLFPYSIGNWEAYTYFFGGGGGVRERIFPWRNFSWGKEVFAEGSWVSRHYLKKVSEIK